MELSKNNKIIKRTKLIILCVLIPFTILTVLAIQQVGVIGILKGEFKNFGTLQVFVDLIIASVLILVWMKKDAKKNNRNFIFWMFLTLALGSFGPLLYILFDKNNTD